MPSSRAFPFFCCHYRRQYAAAPWGTAHILYHLLFVTNKSAEKKLGELKEGGTLTMKDRLEELQQKAQEAPAEGTNPFSVEEDEDESVVVGNITPQAVVFEEEPVIPNFLSEAQKIRDDISVLEAEVRWLNSPFSFDN